MRIVVCTHEKHAGSILGILNEAIETSTSIYDYNPRPLSAMEGWFHSKLVGGFPVIGAESEKGQLLGFASFGTFRGWPAYKYTVEHSVYVQHNHRGQGIGMLLMRELIAVGRAQGRHVLVGGVDAENKGSIALHLKLGFSHAGTIMQSAIVFTVNLILSSF